MNTLVVRVTDDLRTVDVESPEFEVKRRECRVAIHSPADGSVHSAGVPVTLSGSGYYEEGLVYQPSSLLAWSSSIDGHLGEGSSLDVLLSAGEHVLELQGGFKERQATARHKVSVLTEPLE